MIYLLNGEEIFIKFLKMCIRDRVESARILGKNKNVLKLQVKDLHGTRMDAMYFGDVNTFVEYVREKFGDIACECLLRGHGHGIVMAFTYYPDINEYQGVQMCIRDRI